MSTLLVPDDPSGGWVALNLHPEIARARVLSEKEAAAFLRVSPTKMERWRRGGRGPRWVQISERRIGYRAGDLADFTAASVVEPAA